MYSARLSIIFSFFLFSSTKVHCQNQIDSLQNLLKNNIHDTVRVNIYCELASIYTKGKKDYTVAKEYATKAIKTAKFSSFTKGRASAEFILGSLAYRENDLKLATEKFAKSADISDSIGSHRKAYEARYNQAGMKSLRGMLKEALFDFKWSLDKYDEYLSTRYRVAFLGRVADIHENLGEMDSAIFYYEKELEFSKREHYTQGIAAAVNNLGIVYKNMGEIESAIKCYEEALFYSRKEKDSTFEASSLENMGILYSNQDKHVKAMNYYLEAQKIYKELGRINDEMNLEMNLGLIYKKIEEYEKAIQSYKKSLRHQSIIKDTSSMIISTQNIGSAYLSKSDFSNSKTFLNRSFNLFKSSQAGCLNGLGGILGQLYLETEKYDSAHFFLKLELESIEKCQNDLISPSIKFQLGLLSKRTGKMDEAVDFFEESLEEATILENRATMKSSSYELFEWYKSKQRYTEALKYHELYQINSDSLFNKKKTRELAWLEANLEIEKVSDSLNYLKKQEAIEFDAVIQKQSMRTKLIIAILFIIIAISLVYYFYLKKIQKLKLQQVVSHEKENGFKNVINATEQERSRISKDLHDGIGQELSALKLSLNSVIDHSKDDDQKKELTKIASSFSKSADEVRSISHQMMPRALMEKGLVPAIDDLLKNAFQHSNTSYTLEESGVNERFNERIEVSVYRIIQELVNNIIKHAEASQVSVQLISKEDNLLVFVEDDGKGFNSSNQKEGHGLINIKSRAEMINGSVNFEPSSNKGTFVSLSIPI